MNLQIWTYIYDLTEILIRRHADVIIIISFPKAAKV
jgi:hypothetical protein